MDLKHKHWAIIVVSGLVVIFIGLVAWYFLHHHKALAPAAPYVATTTPSEPPVATTTLPLHVSEDAKYYTIDLQYPATTPLATVSAEADSNAVATMKKYAEDTATQFETDGNFANLSAEDIQMQGLDQNKEALSSEYKMYTGSHTVSYVFQIYSDTHGAHPNTYFKTFTFDTRSGKELALSDLFQPNASYLDVLSARTRADLPAIITKQSQGGGADTDDITFGTTPKEDSFANFYIDGASLNIVFAPYQVGPYALGTVIDPIPLGQLSGSLNTSYLP